MGRSARRERKAASRTSQGRAQNSRSERSKVSTRRVGRLVTWGHLLGAVPHPRAGAAHAPIGNAPGVIWSYARRGWRAGGDVIFVEVFRLLLVIAGVVGGLQLGNHIGRDTYAPLLACTLATLVTYVIGGVAGRLFDRGMRSAVRRLRDMPPSEVFAGSVVGSAGLLLGLALGLALVSLVHSTVGYPLAAVLA